jgi:hypothetical protein
LTMRGRMLSDRINGRFLRLLCHARRVHQVVPCGWPRPLALCGTILSFLFQDEACEVCRIVGTRVESKRLDSAKAYF